MSEILNVFSLIPALLAILLCFRAGTRRARKEKWLRLVLFSFFLLFLSWLMCSSSGFYMGFEDAKKYYEEILRSREKPPVPAPRPPINNKIQTA
ncbi:MAG: hypothetical protein Q7S36_03675 [Candidatus Liptonbacteria bacterium]|nr:hypothetical protein [Candidatus Liptonbacteria bacterium]